MLQVAWWGAHSTRGWGISRLSRATGESKHGRTGMSLRLRWEPLSLPGRAISGQHLGDYLENMTWVGVWRVKKCEGRTSLAHWREEGRSLRTSEEARRGCQAEVTGVDCRDLWSHCSYDPRLFLLSLPPPPGGGGFESLGKHRLC